MIPVEVKIKKLNENAVIPTRGSEYAAGYDLYACMDSNESILIKPHQTVKIHTGIAMKLPAGYFGAVFARSGVATKRGLRPANCVGVCDEDYIGEVIVALHNDSNIERMVVGGERIAQYVVIPYQTVAFTEVDELEETERGAGGFGSTGV